MSKENYEKVKKPTELRSMLVEKDRAAETLKSSAAAANDEARGLREDNDRISSENLSLKSRIDGLMEKMKEIDAFHARYKGMEEDMLSAHDLLVIDGEDDLSIKTQIENYRDELLDGEESVRAFIEKAHADIRNFSAEVFGDAAANENPSPGIKHEMERFFDAAQETHNLKMRALDDLYKKYDTQIANLLPGALSAGLSFAHHDTSEFHKGEAGKSQKAFRRTICALVVFGLAFFFAPLLSLLPLFSGMEWTADPVKVLLRTSPITVPLIWLAVSFQLDVKRHARLHAEYKHKENLCKTFEGLRKAAQDRENEALTDLLLTAVIKANEHNPSQTLDKHRADTPVATLVDMAGSLTRNAAEIKNVLRKP